MKKHFILGEKIILGFGAALLSLIIISVLAHWQIHTLLNTNRWVTHTQEILMTLETVFSDIKEVETGQRGYVITGEAPYLEHYQSATAQVEQSLQTLQQLMTDNPGQQERLAGLRPLVTRSLAFTQEVIDLYRAQGSAAAARLITTDTGQQLMDEIRRTVVGMQQEERALLEERTTTANTRTTLALWIITAGNVVALLLVALAGGTISRDLTRRKQAEAALKRTHDELEQRVQERTTDLTQVNAALSQVNVALQQEVTERKRAERQNSRLANYNRLLLESLGEGVYSIDLQGNYTYINERGAARLHA